MVKSTFGADNITHREDAMLHIMSPGDCYFIQHQNQTTITRADIFRLARNGFDIVNYLPLFAACGKSRVTIFDKGGGKSQK